MAITKTTVTSLQALAAWLQENAVPDYFASVSIDANNKIITCSDADGNPLMVYDTTAKTFSIYKSIGIAESFTIASTNSYTANPTSNSPAIVAKCSGGIMILVQMNITDVGSTSDGWYVLDIIITKSNNESVTVIAGTKYTGRGTVLDGARVPALTTGVHAAAMGDETDAVKTTSFYSSVQNQTQFVSFTTYTKPDTISYTPSAFYMPVGEYYSLIYGKFTANGKNYITNGYWAIEDSEV